MTARLAFSETRGRATVADRSAGVCEICQQHRAEGMSHRVAKSRGGTWAPSGLVHACGSGTTGCHGWLEANPLHAGAGGWHIRRDLRAAALVPVYLRPALAWPGWWLLTDDGLYVAVEPDDYDLPDVPVHLPYVPPGGRPLATVPWVDPTPSDSTQRSRA